MRDRGGSPAFLPTWLTNGELMGSQPGMLGLLVSPSASAGPPGVPSPSSHLLSWGSSSRAGYGKVIFNENSKALRRIKVNVNLGKIDHCASILSKV